MQAKLWHKKIKLYVIPTLLVANAFLLSVNKVCSRFPSHSGVWSEIFINKITVFSLLLTALTSAFHHSAFSTAALYTLYLISSHCLRSCCLWRCDTPKTVEGAGSGGGRRWRLGGWTADGDWWRERSGDKEKHAVGSDRGGSQSERDEGPAGLGATHG